MSAMVAAEQLVDEGAVHLVHSEILLPETRGRRRWLCRSTVPISMSAMVAAEQLVDEGAVPVSYTHLTLPTSNSV